MTAPASLPFDRAVMENWAQVVLIEMTAPIDGVPLLKDYEAVDFSRAFLDLLAAYDAAVAERAEEAARKMRMVECCELVPLILMAEAGDAHELASRLGENRTKRLADVKALANAIRAALRAARAGGPEPSAAVISKYRAMKSRAEAAEAECERLRAAADDALSGWRYIRATHGDLSGVGWDRVENALAAALRGEEAKP